MKTFLVAIFLINGEPSFLDGYYPREVKSVEVCEDRRVFMLEYLRSVDGLPEVGDVVCGTEEDIQKRINVLDDPIL